MSDLIAVVADWLEEERRRLAALADELCLTSQRVRAVLVDEKPGSRSYRREFVDRTAEFALERTWRPRVERIASEAARMVAARYGDRCRVHLFSDIDFAAEPAKWVQVELLDRIRDDYVTRLRSLAAADTEQANAQARGLVELLEGDHLVMVECLPVGGLDPHEQLEAGNVRLRPLTSEEHSDLYDARGGFHGVGFSRAVAAPFPCVDETTALEVRGPRVSKSVFPQRGREMRRVLLAFQLTGFRPGGEGHSRVWTEPGPSLHGGTGTLLLPRSCRERRRVAREDLVRVVELAHRIPDSAFMPINRRDVALHRFLRGCAEEIPGEALIDFVIALEAMFLPSHLRNGKGRVLRDRGAEFGGANPTERGNITALLKEAYDVRSLIVHGLAPPAADRVASAYEGVRQFTASVLVKALSEGWPDAEGSTTKTT